MRIGFIYLIRNNVNKKVYVGQTLNSPRRRFMRHKNDARNGEKTQLYYAMRKHGIEAFNMSILRVANEDEMDAMEMIEITRHDSYTSGYNCTIGGGGTSGHVVSEATRTKLRNARLGQTMSKEIKKKIGLSNMGNTHSDESKALMREARLNQPPTTNETRANMAAAHIGNKHSEATKAKMRKSRAKRGPISEETRARLSAAAKRRPSPSEETRARLRASRTGTTHSEATKAKMKAAWARRKQIKKEKEDNA